MIDTLASFTLLDWLRSFLVAFIPLLHTFAKADIVLRPPWSTGFLWTCPLAALATVVLPLIGWMSPLQGSMLLVPYLQWGIVRLLYRDFRHRHGRSPRDAFVATGASGHSQADTSMFAVGSLALVGPPLFAAYGIGKLIGLVAQ